MNYIDFSQRIKEKYPQYKDVDDRDLAQRMIAKYPQYKGIEFDAPKQESSFQEIGALRGLPIGQKMWKGLEVPSQMAHRGLTDIAKSIPEGKITGNRAMDVIRGTPRIAADSLAETAPGFVSRASMLTAGTAPFIKASGQALAPAGRAIASGLEDWAGIKPAGTLREAAKDASLIFSKGKDASGKLYSAAKNELPGMVKEAAGLNPFKGMYKPEQIVDKAREVIDSGEKLEPSEALMYRKAIDQLAKSGRYVKDELFAMRQEADQMAKESENISAADALHKRGMMANAMRSIVPKNVGGRGSPFKVGEAIALAHMGPAGKAVSALFSPLALGTGATVLGGAGRIASNPRSAVAALQLLRKLRGQSEDSNP